MPAQERGYINDKNIESIKPLGKYQERKREYFENIYKNMNNPNNTSITEWFIQRAMSTNEYQTGIDNREIELLSVLNILNKIDERISNDKRSFSIPGGNSVEFTIDGQKRNLKELSTGFTSLIRIVQSIVSGYSFFTNSTDIENEIGVVLIDEIESHLHISWQTRILPILNKIFPNTVFIVATHSSLVLSQLYNGKAYQLVNENGIVKNKEISNPSNEAFVDLLSTAFNVNLNKIKLDNIQSERSEKQQNNLFDTLGITN
nr:AAA family ATPase [Rodentibacter trehalosifermentans]